MTNYTTYAYGHDFGNAKTCGITYVNGIVRNLTVTSALLTGSHRDLAHAAIGDLRQSGTIDDYSHMLKLNGKEYFIGNLAIEQSQGLSMGNLTEKGATRRYWSDRNLAFLLSVSGTLIQDKEYGLCVVTGLPIETYKDEQNISSVKSTLEGTHTFELDGEFRTAHVTVKKVLMEGSGANIAHGASGNTKIGIIDIGGRTTDIYMTIGQRPISSLCQSHDKGVLSALEDFTKAFQALHRYTFKASDIEKLQTLYTSGKDYTKIIAVRNKGVSAREVGDMFDRSLRSVGESIVSFINQHWGESLGNDTIAGDVDRILLIGGGAYYFEPEIRAMFPRLLSIPVQPECANAAGYAKLASHFLSRETRLAAA